MINLKIVDEIDNIEKVRALLYECYPIFSIDDDPILSKDPTQKLIKLEQISFLVSLQHSTKFYIIVEDGEDVVGFASLNTLAIEYFYALSWVGVAKSHRGRGIGKQITQEAVAFCKRRNNELILSTDIPNFYTKLGFTISNEFKPGWWVMCTTTSTLL